MGTRNYMLFVLVLGLTVANAKYFKFEDCSKENKIAEVSEFKMSPDPVNMKKNMTIDMILKVLRDIPEEAVLKTRYYKIKSLFGVTFDVLIPCLLGKFGSCTIPLCEHLEMFKAQAEPFFPEDKEYGCPVKAGDYGGNDLEIEMPYIPPIARIIVGGKYRTELQLLDKPRGKELACFKIWSEIK